jgi:hypothetical protein
MHGFEPSAARSFPSAVVLEIVQEEGDAYFYLMYIPKAGLRADSFHLTLDDAKRQAESEFGIKEDEWIKTERPFQ